MLMRGDPHVDLACVTQRLAAKTPNVADKSPRFPECRRIAKAPERRLSESVKQIKVQVRFQWMPNAFPESGSLPAGLDPESMRVLPCHTMPITSALMRRFFWRVKVRNGERDHWSGRMKIT